MAATIRQGEGGKMAGLLAKLFSRLCPHEFTWPRLASDGTHYQVCGLCGDRYRYNWETMSREERMLSGAGELAPAAAGTPNWRPRARRLRVGMAGLWRAHGGDDWKQAFVQNVSESGALVAISGEIKAGADIELVFEMPREICGQRNSQVLSRGKVTRIAYLESESLVGVAIADYIFLHGRRPPASHENWVEPMFAHSRGRWRSRVRKA
jgi:hypothetical protein